MNCVSSPPSYWRAAEGLGLAPESQELPAYSRRNTLHGPIRREPTEHIYQLTEGKSRPWATLKLYSSAKSAKSLPTFFEKDLINASFDIYAEKGDSIQQITAVVTGRIITGAGSSDAFMFLCETLPIWSKSLDVSRVPSLSEGASGSKLLGKCEWPISITLPKAVNIPNANGEACFYRLPETFLERHTKVSVQYDFSILISRGKLRPDSQIKTAFGFIPNTRPEPPSVLRRLAYQHGTPLPGPSSDPEGWKTLRSVAARGTRKHPSLSSYFRIRRVRYYHANSSARQDVAWNESAEDVGTAVWWPSEDGTNDRRGDRFLRHMDGEIRLAKDLRPSSAMGHYSLSYSVALCQFSLAHYSSDSVPLLSEPVEITTMYAKGARPIAYSPPAYEHGPQRSNEQYVAHY
ncbi:hypothetical protein AX17_007414 [Amanita inopinata Kibby_2008]|nr:hypothetical protein AX17_007414 [Amanita inopinata Kibby_2008]